MSRVESRSDFTSNSENTLHGSAVEWPFVSVLENIRLQCGLHGFEMRYNALTVCQWPRRPIMAEYTFIILISSASFYLHYTKAW